MRTFSIIVVCFLITGAGCATSKGQSEGGSGFLFFGKGDDDCEITIDEKTGEIIDSTCCLEYGGKSYSCDEEE